MYQRSDQAGAILGDFTRDDPVRTFKKEDVAYTIGSRWEQMYVTVRGNEEYLLPAKWLIAQKKWAPLDETHRRSEPISKTCHGCHTTAFNPQTNRFAASYAVKPFPNAAGYGRVVMHNSIPNLTCSNAEGSR